MDEFPVVFNPTVANAGLAPKPVAESAGTLLDGLLASFNPATFTALIDTSTTLKVRDNVLIGTPPARFLRVKVTAAP